MPQSLSNTLIHVVFSTKNRVHFVDDNIEGSLFGYVGQICNNLVCQTITVGGYRNHIHIFCSLHRTVSQSKLVKEIKSNSSKWVKTQDLRYKDFYWQDGYAVFSVSQSKSSNLINYIENQKDHHSKISFQDEYRNLLEVNKIPFDEKYIWD
jgi:REP element-mobilizing transposase RayT